MDGSSGLAAQLAVASSGLEEEEIQELSALFAIHAAKRPEENVITESEAKHLWNILGVESPDLHPAKRDYLLSRNVFLVRTGEYLQMARADPQAEEKACMRMLDPHDRGTVTTEHLQTFLESTGLELQPEEVAILTERVDRTGSREAFSKEDFISHMSSEPSRQGRERFERSLTGKAENADAADYD
eukprot:g6393.t1